MTSTAPSEKEPLPLWRYVAIADYDIPAQPVTHTAREGLTILRRLFKRAEPESDSPLKSENELRMLPESQLEQVVPATDWRGAAEALDLELTDWLRQEKPKPPVILLVGPPHGGHSDILTAWAERNRWQVLNPPTPEQLLAQDDTWLSNQSSDGGPWVFPVLEQAYLRHATGLSLIRRFLDRVNSGSLGRGIVGCDSWACAFLRYVWRGRQPITLTLQAFDHTGLASHFQVLAGSSKDTQLLFRQADNGNYVLPPPDTSGISAKESRFLRHLAAYSRGVLGIAWAVWRDSLRTEPDETVAEETESKNLEVPHHTIWVTPWSEITHPSLPDEAGSDEAFVLHTLLLHNGLPFELVRQLLPLAQNKVMEILYRLEEAGLVALQDSLWQVSPQGYPAVRQFLKSNDFLVDQI